ncbi:MAG: VOC family protein [Chloroflexota bacterium]
MFRAERLDHIAVQVQDLERSIAWYQTVLGLEERERYHDTTGRGTPVVLCSGQACLALFPPQADGPLTPLQGHIAFRLDRANFDRARHHVATQGIAFRFVAYKTVHSLYFHDLDGL